MMFISKNFIKSYTPAVSAAGTLCRWGAGRRRPLPIHRVNTLWYRNERSDFSLFYNTINRVCTAPAPKTAAEIKDNYLCYFLSGFAIRSWRFDPAINMLFFLRYFLPLRAYNCQDKDVDLRANYGQSILRQKARTPGRNARVGEIDFGGGLVAVFYRLSCT